MIRLREVAARAVLLIGLLILIFSCSSPTIDRAAVLADRIDDRALEAEQWIDEHGAAFPEISSELGQHLPSARALAQAVRSGADAQQWVDGVRALRPIYEVWARARGKDESQISLELLAFRVALDLLEVTSGDD